MVFLWTIFSFVLVLQSELFWSEYVLSVFRFHLFFSLPWRLCILLAYCGTLALSEQLLLLLWICLTLVSYHVHSSCTERVYNFSLFTIPASVWFYSLILSLSLFSPNLFFKQDMSYATESSQQHTLGLFHFYFLWRTQQHSDTLLFHSLRLY